MPILTLANPTTGPEHRITWTSSDMIRVSATGRVPGNWVWVNGQCVPGGGNLPLKYTWQQLSGPIVDLSNLGSMVAQVTTASFASPTLVMPGSVLQVGFDYSFQVRRRAR